MTSLNNEKNDKQYSGNELDEPKADESDSIQEENISGDELDEPKADESDSIQEKKNGSELVLDELNLPPITVEGDSEDVGKDHRENKRITLFIALGLCLLIGIGYLYLKEKVFDILQEKETTQLHGLKKPEDQLLLFHSFVIPLKEKKDLTYISLSISFNVPNKELRQEIIEKKELLRGIMYDILREEINRIEEIPPLEKIKCFLTKRVNMALSAGKVNEVYITKFLAV